MMPKATYSGGVRNRHSVSGTDTAATSDPREENRLIATTTIHTAAATRAAWSDSPARTPNDVAIPLPPRNPRKIDQLWPAIAAGPAATTAQGGWPAVSDSSTGTSPFSTSTSSAAAATAVDATRRT